MEITSEKEVGTRCGKTEAGEGTARDGVGVVWLDVLLLTQLSQGRPAPAGQPGSASGYVNNEGMAAHPIDPPAAGVSRDLSRSLQAM